MNTLLMRLAGPMQSWGSRSRFDDRDTGLEPTRSGVIGLLCAALGWERDSELSRFESLQMGVRVDAPGRVMVDYQTALDVIKADGSGRDTVQSWRYYLADARFLVGLASEDAAWLEELDVALRDPVWPLFLGRKSFPPSLPVALPGTSGILRLPLEEALCQAEWEPVFEPKGPETVRLVLETAAEIGTARPDRPVSFAQRRFALRHVVSRDVPVSMGRLGGH